MAMLDGIKLFSFTPYFYEKLNIWHICLTFIKGNTMNKTDRVRKIGKNLDFDNRLNVRIVIILHIGIFNNETVMPSFFGQFQNHSFIKL